MVFCKGQGRGVKKKLGANEDVSVNNNDAHQRRKHKTHTRYQYKIYPKMMMYGSLLTTT